MKWHSLYLALLYIFILLFISSCEKEEIPKPCRSNMPIVNDTLKLTDSSYKWILHNTGDIITFTNSNGFNGAFKVFPKRKFGMTLLQRLSDDCGTKENSYYAEGIGVDLVCENLPWYITYRIIKNITFDHTRTDLESIQPDTTGDVLNLIFTNNGFRAQSFAISLTNYPIYQKYNNNVWRLLPELEWGGKNYYNVYEAYIEPKEGEAKLYMKRMFYTRELGIIGFEFINGEKWYRN